MKQKFETLLETGLRRTLVDALDQLRLKIADEQWKNFEERRHVQEWRTDPEALRLAGQMEGVARVYEALGLPVPQDLGEITREEARG